MIVALTREDLKTLTPDTFTCDYVNGSFYCGYNVKRTAMGTLALHFQATPQVDKNNLILRVPYKSIKLPVLLALFGSKIQSTTIAEPEPE